MSHNIASLEAVHRWCLPGTPFLKGLIDIYAFVRFLRVPRWQDQSEFRSHIVRTSTHAVHDLEPPPAR